jgi:hypothetical protein
MSIRSPVGKIVEHGKHKLEWKFKFTEKNMLLSQEHVYFHKYVTRLVNDKSMLCGKMVFGNDLPPMRSELALKTFEFLFPDGSYHLDGVYIGGIGSIWVNGVKEIYDNEDIVYLISEFRKFVELPAEFESVHGLVETVSCHGCWINHPSQDQHCCMHYDDLY